MKLSARDALMVDAEPERLGIELRESLSRREARGPYLIGISEPLRA